MFTTRRLNRATKRRTPAYKVAESEASAIDRLSGKNPLRLHSVGDAKTVKAVSILVAALIRYVAKYGQKVWTYTHAWRRVPRAVWSDSVSVLASCETADDIKHARKRGYATAIVVPEHIGKVYFIGDEKIVACPEQTRGVKCDQCRLCWDDANLRKHKVTIGFAAHSPNANKVKNALASIGE
jgi:hypothetical protein